MKEFGHKVAIKDAQGEVTGLRVREPALRTRNVLPGNYGADKGRHLVVSLRDGDLIVIRPARSPKSRELTITAIDLYAQLVRNQANRLTLEKARARKERLKDLRVSRRIAAADKRLRDAARKEAQ